MRLSELASYLYHGTSSRRAQRIISNGPRLAGTRKGTFGRAFYLSSKPIGTRFYDKGAVLVFRFRPEAIIRNLRDFQRHGRGDAQAVESNATPPYGDCEIAVFDPGAIEFVGWYNKMTGQIDDHEPVYPTGFYHNWNAVSEGSAVTISSAVRRLYHASPATIERFAPFSHFGTEAAARARAGNWKYQGQSVKLYAVDFVARNPIRVRDFKMAPAVHNWSSLVDALHYTVRKISANERDRIYAAAAPSGQNTEGGERALVEVLHEHGWDAIVYRNRFEDAGQDSWVNLTWDQVRIVEVTEL